MAHVVYILYSAQLDRYYVGDSDDPHRRLEEHRTHFYKGSATAKASDWILLQVIHCLDRAHARRLEGWIKAQKSRSVINRLLDDAGYRDYQVQRFQ